MALFLLKVISVAIAHCVVSVALYRARVLYSTPVFKSDFLVFFLPSTFALIAYAVVFWKSGFCRGSLQRRAALALGFSMGATFASSWIFMLIAFNTYGT